MADPILLAIVCCLMPTLLAGFVGLALFLALRGRSQTFQQVHSLARELGLTASAPKGNVMYVGEHQGRAYGLGFGVIGSSASRTYRPGVHLTLEVQPRSPWPMHSGCSRFAPGMDFEAAFKASLGAERLSPLARAAMLEFVSRRTRLWLDGHRPLRLRPAPAPETPMYLGHTLPGSNANAAGVLTVLNELAEVAGAIEDSH